MGIVEYGFGRVPHFDPQSLRYPIRTMLPEKPLRSYTWNVPINLDQGTEGACVGFTFTHELAARPVPIPGLTDGHARQHYFEAQRIDPWEGGAYPGANPFYEGTAVLAGAKVMQARGFYSGYRWAFGEEDVARTLGYLGPVVIGVNWYDGMFRPDADGFLNITGRVAGGHAILVHAVNVKADLYWLWNSWGPRWGLGGRAKIRRPDLARLLREDGEACVPQRVKTRRSYALAA